MKKLLILLLFFCLLPSAFCLGSDSWFRLEDTRTEGSTEKFKWKYLVDGANGIPYVTIFGGVTISGGAH